MKQPQNPSASETDKPSTKMGRRVARWGLLVALVAGCSVPSAGQVDPHAQIDPSKIDDHTLVVLPGNTHPAAIPSLSTGPMKDDFLIEHMQLVLKRAPDHEAALVAHIDALHDKTSPLYHQWLTAEEFGDQYGVAKSDIAAITAWLTKHGFKVEGVPVSRMYIDFTGTVAQINAAFHTQIHTLTFKGVTHFGNMSDPSIPAELAKSVVGVTLHNFMPKPMHKMAGVVQRDDTTGAWRMVSPSPEFTGSTGGAMPQTFYALAPADFYTIYNLNPLLTGSPSVTGAGQTIAVIGNSNIRAADPTTFRTAFGLASYKGTWAQIHPAGATTCTNPGRTASEGEAALDSEWSGAAAPDAAIELASCADTSTVFGGQIAIQNLLNSATPPNIISLSWGLCEAASAAGTTTWVNIWQQAATLGVSAFVASGDAGAAICDNPNTETTATQGIAVNSFGSTPYNVSVGGTDFMDLYDSLAINGGPAQTTYWNATNTATFGSAKGYVPEIPWNDSCASKLIYTALKYTQAYGATGACNTAPGNNFVNFTAGGGGPSSFSKQPTWQTGVFGLPTKSGAAQPRYLPDVSLFAGNGVWSHFYVFCDSDIIACTYPANATSLAAGGTSFATPAMAGIQALINQKMGANQGNPNYTLYKLAGAEQGAKGSTRCNSAGGTPAAPILPHGECIFNDVTQGDIAVACTGATNCFGSGGGNVGVLSTSNTTLNPAYAAGTGWDFASGLGTVNAYNLVTAWSK